jgi:hypothetical protein
MRKDQRTQAGIRRFVEGDKATEMHGEFAKPGVCGCG